MYNYIYNFPEILKNGSEYLEHLEDIINYLTNDVIENKIVKHRKLYYISLEIVEVVYMILTIILMVPSSSMVLLVFVIKYKNELTYLGISS